MPSPPDPSHLIPETLIATLAELYDRFANTLDPLDQSADEAEEIFNAEIARWHDTLPPEHRLSPAEFRRAIVQRCRRYLKANPINPPPPQ